MSGGAKGLVGGRECATCSHKLHYISYKSDFSVLDFLNERLQKEWDDFCMRDPGILDNLTENRHPSHEWCRIHATLTGIHNTKPRRLCSLRLRW
jgi:hypothetical protein